MKNFIIACVLAFVAISAFGQKSMVIGTNVTNKPNAILVLNPPGANQGFLLPQLTKAEREAIEPDSPAEDGLVVYDLTEKSFYYWKEGIWTKGLGNGNNQTLSYDPATQTITLSNGNTINLSTLKEIPNQTGHGGQFLTTDGGTTLSWTTIGTFGDITGVTAGAGLTGGASSDEATLAVNVDGTTISIASNQLQLADQAVTVNKIAANAVTDAKILSVTPAKLTGGGASNGQILKWNGTAWTPQNESTGTVTSITAGTGLTGGIITGAGTLALSNTGVTANTYGSGTQIPILTIDAQGRVITAGTAPITGAAPTGAASGDLEGSYPNPTVKNNAITSGKIIDDAINTSKIADGSIQTIDLSNDAVTSLKIADGTIAAIDLANSSVTDIKIVSVTPAKLTASGATTGQVLKWNGTSWTPQNDNAGAGTVTSITATGGLNGGTITTSGNISLADGGVTDVKLAASSVTTAKIADGTIAAADVADDAITSAKLSPTGATAGAYGTTTQVPSFTIDAKGRIVTITNTPITGVSPAGAATGDLSGNYPNPTIAGGAGTNVVAAVNNALTAGTLNTNRLNTEVVIGTEAPAAGDITGTFNTGLQIGAGTVTTTEIASGGNNRILTTGGTGTVTWATGIPTSSLLPSGATAGKLLVFNGTNWVPENATVDGTTIAGAGIPADPFRVKPGTANQVLITNGSNAVTWVNQNALAPNLTAVGDVTGPLNATVVTKLQGINVSTTDPTDDQILQFDLGTNQWVPVTVPGVSTSVAFKVNQTAQQTIPNNILTPLNWAAELYDDGNNFNTASETFTAPSAGLYHFDATVTMEDINNNNRLELRLRVFNAGFTDIQRKVTTGVNADLSISISTDVKLNAGDQVSLWIESQDGEQTIVGAFTQFSGRKIY